MNSLNKIKRLAMAMLALLILAAGAVSAQASTTPPTVLKNLTAGSVSGTAPTGGATESAEIALPITIDNPADVAGMAFTITYDPAILHFIRLEQVTTGWVVSNGDAYQVPVGEVVNGVTYYNPYNHADPYSGATYPVTGTATLFYQYNDVQVKNAQNQDVSAGRVLVSAASATPLPQTTPTTIFNAIFKIKSGSFINGTKYPIRLVRSIINNPVAGYNVDSFLPVLVGAGPFDQSANLYRTLEFPILGYQFNDGGITVNAPVYSLGGKVTYGSAGANAAGCPVTLLKLMASGEYAPVGQTTVGSSGLYSFTGKPAGSYKLDITSLDPMYYGYKSEAFGLNASVSDKNVALDQKPQLPAPISGIVTAPGGGSLPADLFGLKVKVVDPSGVTMGVYSVASNGAWTSLPLPPLATGQSYRWFIVYGSLISGENAATFDASQLRTISGTISGMAAGSSAAVTAISVTGKLQKTVGPISNSEYTIKYLVPANDYIVSVVASGLPVTYYNGKTDVNEATPVQISLANAVNINFDFTPPAGHIKGWVKESGVGVNGLTVYGFDVNDYGLYQTTTANIGGENGSYDLEVKPGGNYEVFVIKGNGRIFYFYNEDGTPTQKESNAVLRTVTSAAQPVLNTNIDIAECNKTLTGEVTYRTAGGDPVANALITVSTATQRAIGLTGQDGRYSVGGLCEAAYAVEMKPLMGSYAVQDNSITFGAADTTKTMNFVIDTGAVLSGTVTELNSSPLKAIAGAMLFLKDKDTGALVGGRVYFTDQDGKYSIGDIARDVTYSLEVTHPDYRSQTLDIPISDNVTLDVTLDKGAYFKGTVTEKDSNPTKKLAGVTIIIARADTTPVYTVTDSNGFYSVYGLNADLGYMVIAQKRGYEGQKLLGVPPGSLKPTIPGTVVDIALPLPTQYYSLTGTVTTTAAEPDNKVSNAIVLVSSATKNFFASTTTGLDGKYTVVNLVASGDYKVVVIPPNNMPTQVATGVSTNTANAEKVITKDFSIDVGRDIGGTVTGSVAIPATTKIYVFLYRGTTYVGFTTTKSGVGGAFLFKGMTSGANYRILVTATGYTPQWVGNDQPIDISGASKLDLNVTLVKP